MPKIQKFNFDLTQYTGGALGANIIATTLLYYFLYLEIEYTISAVTTLYQYITTIEFHPLLLIIFIPLLLIAFVGFFSITLVLLAFFFTLLFISSKLTILTIFQLLKDTKNDIKFIYSSIFK